MSTILKALKKLEDQSAPPRADTPRPTLWQRRPLGHSGLSGSFRKLWVPVALAAVAALALGGWIWWRNDQRPPTAFQEIPAPQAPSASAPPPPLAPLAPRKIAPVDERSAPPAASPASKSGNRQKNEPRAPRQAAPKPPEKPAAPESTRSRPPQPDRQHLRPAAAMNPSRPAITIQAIAWSIDPSNRIAVIDGSVVHEGDALGEVRVSEIGKNHVALTDGDHTWTVTFGKP